MTARESVAVLVAHPDDETLWVGGTLLSQKGWSVVIACACRGGDSDRAPKFARVLTHLGAQGSMADLDDGPEQLPLPEETVESALLQCLPARQFDRIITHSPLGEYTRHRRHEEVARAVLRLWLRRSLVADEVWLFAYDDAGGTRLPEAAVNADVTRELSSEVWQRKHQLITREYGFADTSWEARVTPQIESFFRVTTAEEALRWLERTKNP